MSLSADFDLKERVRAALDIADVVGRDLELRPQGRHFVARCPFHQDNRPSMTVNPERQIWKCWVCDIGGDIFSFVMRREGVDFPTALKFLAEQAGIPFEPSGGPSRAEPGTPGDKATLLQAVRLVSDAYYQLLESGASDEAAIARDYLHRRGIDDESRRRFRIGFAPANWSFAVDLLRKHNLSGEVGEAAGLVLPRRSGGGHYDRFRGRLMFPIHDLQDRPVSLGGRIIPEIADRDGRGNRDGKGDGGAKYINGPETLLFRKSHQLYGLQLARDAIRQSGEVLVMEGYTDVVAARQAGIEPVVAVLGTALGDQHIKILQRFAERVVLVLDGDAAGQRRAEEVTELFVRADIDLRVMSLPEGLDPADFLAERGSEAFGELVQQAPDALDHRLARLTDGLDVTHDTHRATSALDTVLRMVAKAPRGGGLRTDQLMLRLSRTFGIGEPRLQQRLESLREEDRRRQRRPRPRVDSGAGPQRSAASRRGASPQSAEPEPSADPNQLLAESADTGDSTSVSFGGRPADGTAADGSGHRMEPSRLSPVTGIDRELFETLIEYPELAAMAVEAIDPDWLGSDTAKMILSAYQDLDLQGRTLDFESLMLVVENDHLKSQLVTLQERVRHRQGSSTESAEARYTAAVTRYREREFTEEKNRHIARLESKSLPEDEELALLQELIEAERSRMGIPGDAP